jgi:hypothetical protein
MASRLAGASWVSPARATARAMCRATSRRRTSIVSSSGEDMPEFDSGDFSMTPRAAHASPARPPAREAGPVQSFPRVAGGRIEVHG